MPEKNGETPTTSTLPWVALILGVTGLVISLILGIPELVIGLFIVSLCLPGLDLVINGAVLALCLAAVAFGVVGLRRFPKRKPGLDRVGLWIGTATGGIGAILTTPWIIFGLVMLALFWGKNPVQVILESPPPEPPPSFIGEAMDEADERFKKEHPEYFRQKANPIYNQQR